MTNCRKNLGLAILAFALSGAAASQDAYPDRVVKFVVPYGAGGSTDVVARIVAQKLTERMGKTVLVENRAGANGIVGTALVAKSAADGYTFLLASNGQAVNVSLYKNLPYDLTHDFVRVVNVASMPNVLAVHPDQPIKSVKELVAFAKSNPGKLAFAHAGVGSSQHLSGELLKLLAGIDMRQVPYKGGGPAVMDALGGHVQLVFAGLPAIVQQAKSGLLRPIAVTGPKRSPQLPDVPTMMEEGYPSYNEVFWVGIIAPRGVPEAVVNRISSEVNKVLALPDVLHQLEEQGVEPAGGTPEQFGAFLKQEINKDAGIIKAANITQEN